MRRSRYALISLVTLGLTVAASCESNSVVVSGTVQVNGTPVETGTIHFRSSDSATASAGATIRDGKFNVGNMGRLVPGKYKVTLEAFKKTGRRINDPQRGSVPETVQLRTQQAAIEVQIDEANAANLNVSFDAEK